MRSVKKALKALDKPDPSQSQSEQVDLETFQDSHLDLVAGVYTL